MKKTINEVRRIIREEYTKIQLSQILNDIWHQYKNGNRENAPRLRDPADISEYINGKLKKITVSKIKIIERGKTYPYNRSDPYTHDIYDVTLSNGLTCTVDVYMGSPTWEGNVSYLTGISIK